MFADQRRSSPLGAVFVIALVIAAQSAAGQQASAQPAIAGATKPDPYKNFKFRVKWDARYLSDVFFVSPLNWTTEVVEYRDGGDANSSRTSPGRTRFAPIVIRRPVTHDADFEKWANQVWSHSAPSGGNVSPGEFRKDIVIELYDEAGRLIRRYNVFRCWPSEYEAISALDAEGNEVLVESLTLQNEGWERDSEIDEPTEASHAEPQ